MHFLKVTWTDDVHDENFKNDSAQPVSDTFFEPVPELSRKLQLEHHPFVRLLKAVHGLVDDPRRWYHRVANDLPHMRGEESRMEPCLWTFRGDKCVIQALCSVYVVIACWRAVTLHLENVSLTAAKLCLAGEHGSHACSHNVAHGSRDFVTNTRKHWRILRSVSQNTRKSVSNHIDLETENPKSLHLSCLNFEP